jgi:hypothetical protein
MPKDGRVVPAAIQGRQHKAAHPVGPQTASTQRVREDDRHPAVSLTATGCVPAPSARRRSLIGVAGSAALLPGQARTRAEWRPTVSGLVSPTPMLSVRSLGGVAVRSTVVGFKFQGTGTRASGMGTLFVGLVDGARHAGRSLQSMA